MAERRVRRTRARTAGYAPLVPTPETDAPTPPVATSQSVPVEPSRGGWRRVARWTFRLLLVLAALVVVVLAVQSLIAYSAVRDARVAEQRLSRDMTSADLAGARVDAERLADATSRARQAVWGLWWALPEAVPWYGDDVRAVRLTVTVLDDVAQRIALPLARSTTVIDKGLRADDGTVDVAVLDRLQTELAAASAQAHSDANRLRAINPNGLAGPLRLVVQRAQGGVDRLARTVQSASDGVVLVRTLVGAKQPRVTLLGVQNPAEARGTGGIIGAWALLRGSGGRLGLTSTGVNNQLIPYPPPGSELPPDVLATYGDNARDVRNVNISPDFPVAARLLAGDYRRYAAAQNAQPLPADALVMTVTPRALARLLKVGGPLHVRGYPGEINSDNAADIFTNGVYTVFSEQERRTAFVEKVLGDVFARLQRPSSDPVELLRQVQRTVADRDLMAWSPDPGTQGAITRLGMSGRLPEPDGRTAIVSLVNSDASKLDFYLRASVVLHAVGDGERQLTITLNNVAPRSVATYVGNHHPGESIPSTTHDVIVQLHLPPTVGVGSVLLDGRATGVGSGTEAGWTVIRRAVRLSRGSSTSLTVRLTGSAERLETVVPPVLTSSVKVHIESAAE